MVKMDTTKLLENLYEEASGLVTVPNKWILFLKSASWNYKYQFQNQLLIYSQRPDATACASFDVWNSKLHRYVARGSKGIAVLNDLGDKVQYVFDVSDTRSASNEELKLWKIHNDNYPDVLERLNETNSFKSASIEDAIVQGVDASVEEVLSLFLPEGEDLNGAFAEEFKERVRYSAYVVSLYRCGFENAAEVYANKYLSEVPVQIDNADKVIALGTAVSSVSETVLREVEREVRFVEKTFKELKINNLEVNENGNDIQNGRGISDSGNSSEGVSDRENRENGDAAVEVSSSEQTDPIHDSADARGVGEPSEGDRGFGEETDGAVNSESFEGESGTEERDESVGLGTAHELDSAVSGGDGEEGIDLPLDDVLFPTVEEQLEIIESADVGVQDFELSQEDIDCVLTSGSGFVHGKYRIYDYFLEKHTAKEKAEFLKNEYGLGGGTRVLSDGTWGSSWSDAKGLRISRSGHSMSDSDVVLSWTKVQKRIGELIKAGRYLNEKELVEYPSYKTELELRIARISVSEEFKNVILDYNSFLRENDGESEQLNQYVLVVGCASELVNGHKKTNLGEKEGEFILPLMRDALNTIIASESPLKERAEAVLESLQGDVVKDLEPVLEDASEVKEEFVSVPSYKVGDLFFNGATKYSVVEISADSVYLSDVEFELNSLELSKEAFEKIIKENPSNNHLLREIRVEDYNTLINHAVSVVDEVEKSLLPDEEFDVDIIDLVRVGDFFEIRGDAAVRVSDDLELVLTSRTIDGERVPMVGFPIRYLDDYNRKAESKGYIMREAPVVELSEASEVVENDIDKVEGVKRNSLVARNYDALNRLASGVLNGDYTYLHFERDGLEPLTVENVGDNLISVMHSFVQNGDLMRDPDIVLLVDNANKTASAVSYEMSSIGLYKEYMDFETGKILDEAGQKETDSFLSDWFKNIERQQYVLVRGEKENGDSVYFDKDGNEISEEVPEGVSERFQVRLYRPYSAPDTVKAYVCGTTVPLEEGHIVEDEREVFESREAAEADAENFNTVFGFDEEFRSEVLGRVPEPVLHRYYSTQRPVGPGTYPKVAGNEDVNVVNFDEREFVQEIDRAAWGYIEFERALSEKQAEDYELVKAPFESIENDKEENGVASGNVLYVGQVFTYEDGNEYRIGIIDGTDENDLVHFVSVADDGKHDVDSYGYVQHLIKQQSVLVEDKTVERGVGELTGEVIPGDNVELREGDIVEFSVSNPGFNGTTVHTGVVEWNEGYNSYVIAFDDLAMRFLSQETHNIKKIGSIYNAKEQNADEKSVSNDMQGFAVRLRLNDEFVGGIEAYIEKADIPCPETDIEVSVYDTEKMATDFRSYIERAIEDNTSDYREKQYSALLDKKIVFLENEVASLVPTVTCVWSEHRDFEDGKVYSFVEFNSLMKKLDDEVVKLKEEYSSRNDYYPYFKTKFEIHFPDGYEYEGRQDVGDGDGSLFDHVRAASARNLKRIKEDGYDGRYEGEEREKAIKDGERFLSVYLPLLEEAVRDGELSYDKEAYDIGYGSLGNGTTVWNRADTDKEAGDYRTIAHISNDGTVKFYVEDLPEGVKAEIRDKAVGFTADFFNDVLAMSEENFKFWYFNQMVQVHPTFIPGKDFQMQDYIKCYQALHDEGFVRDVSLPLIVQLENTSNVLSKASEETRRDIVDKVSSGEISMADVSEALKNVGASQINNADDVYDVLASKFVDETPVVAPNEKGSNFKIKDVALGVGGPKEKYRNNVAAIRLLKELEREGRQATSDEQEVLSKYVGWGGLDKAFDVNNGSWANEYTELQELLSTEEYRSAKASTLSSFYTQPVVINAVYEGLRNLGFKRGNVLEPSCGVGNFFGMLPDDFADSKLYGVELDSVSGRIAKQLYPEAKIAVKGYEETNFKDGFFDVAIGNVPFGQFKVNDKDYNEQGFLIHDYFFAKTLDKVRPGGVIAFITSKGTLDKQNPEVRKYIAQRAELLGAIRLPNNAFLANAGTKATSDIVFLKKRDRAIDIEPDWVHLGLTDDGIPINSYFVDHPEMVLGHMEMDRMQRGREDSTCVPFPDSNLEDLLKGAVKNINGEISEKVNDFDEMLEDTSSLVKSIEADPDVRNFSFVLVDDDIYYRMDHEMIKQELNPTQEKRVRGMIELRDCLRHLIDLQRYNHSEAEIDAGQSRLNKLYDEYTAKYGLLNSRGNSMAFDDDSSYYLLCSLENVDEKGELISKADMFTKRTIKPHAPVKSVGTASEALSVCISEKAKVDLDFMSDLASLPKDKIIEDLVGVIYRVPEAKDEYGNDLFVTADEYLSGNVRDKLKVAQRVAENDHSFDVNVLALEKVMPKDLGPQDISVRLGSIWVPDDVVNEFMWELLETPKGYRSEEPEVKAHYNSINGSWVVENSNWYSYSVLANSTFGTKRISAYEIIEQTLNLKNVEIYDYVENEKGNRVRVLNKTQTVIAQQKQEAIKNAFVDWVWQDPERRQRLVRLYNDRFNSTKPREYNGEHLVFEGMNPEITLMEHQKNAIAHAIYGGNTLLAHEVGAGKTFEMTAIAMESKRLGLCAKSLVVVPNHLIGQWASEFYQLYPSANLLVASKKDFTPANRKKFCSRIATGDYDAVIIGHSQFEKIPLSIDLQKRFIQEELDEVIWGIEELSEENGNRASVKSLEKTRKNLETRLERLNDIVQDDVITFDALGVDKIFVDEAHYFKNLFLYTKMSNVAGISQTDAKKSSDLYMKSRYLNETTNGKGVVFATGTPISNSMTELYTMQRYLQYNGLRDSGLAHFDAWASTFGEVQTAVELAPEGTGYRAKNRFAKFYNIPELMTMFKEIADIKTGDDLDLPKPNANFHVVQAEPTKLQEQIVESLGERAEKVRGGGVEPTEDNMLKITNDGRLLGLDQRCYDSSLPDDENSKVNLAVNNIYEVWDKYKDDRLAQLVFCDISTPNGNGEFSVYDDVKQKLIARGVPENEIAFIHDAKTDVQKDKLFAKVRSGEVRVLMGSTFKMGAGTNVQDKLIALHDLDCPWRPSDLEQRLGRILRQGNQQKEVEVFRYVTKGTFDAYLWQLVENKQKFISQIMTSKAPVRSVDDVDDAALSYAEIKSLCIKDPRIKEKMELDVDVAKLKVVRANFLSQKYRLEDDINLRYPLTIKKLEQEIAGYKADIERVEKFTVEDSESGFSPMVVNGVTYAEKVKAGEALLKACQGVKDVNMMPVGEYRGFKLSLQYEPFRAVKLLHMKGALTHTVELGKSDTGNILRMDNLLKKLDESLSKAEQKLVDVKKDFETAKVEVLKEFPQEDELKAKTARLDELDAMLRVDEKGGGEVDSFATVERFAVKDEASQADVVVEGIDLLSKDQYNKARNTIPYLHTWWLVHNDGTFSDRIRGVYFSNDVNDLHEGGFQEYGIRPALNINAENLSVGDNITILGNNWTIIKVESESCLALCDGVIGKMAYNDSFVDYKTSDVKSFLNNWLTEKKRELVEDKETDKVSNELSDGGVGLDSVLSDAYSRAGEHFGASQENYVRDLD